MDIISWIKTTLSKYSSNSTHDKNAIYFVKNEDGKTGKIISDEIVYGNGSGGGSIDESVLEQYVKKDEASVYLADTNDDFNNDFAN